MNKKSNYCYISINPDSCHKKNNICGGESTISTNRDSIHNKNSTNSNNISISHYSNFGNYKKEENNIYSFLNKYEDKKDYNNNFLISTNNFKTKKLLNIKNNFTHKYISQFNINCKGNKEKTKNIKTIIYPLKSNNYLNNEKNISIKNKTLNILNLNLNEKPKDKEANLKRCISNYLSENKEKKILQKKNKLEINKRKYCTEKNRKNKKLIRKRLLETNISEMGVGNNNFKENNINKFNSNKKKLELIKQQYKENKINTQKIFHEVKYNFNKIKYYNNTIIDFNNKSQKYSDLISINDLTKYKIENIRNLKKYKNKLKQNNNKRPLSYNKNKKQEKKIKTFGGAKEKIINTKKQKRKEIKEELINNRVLEVLKNDSENNNIKNCLDYYNYLLWNNKEKRQLFFDELENKSNPINNNQIRKSHSCPYKYEINLDKGYYNNNNIDKNLHLKYIYQPGNEMNQNLYYQKLNDNSSKNYYISSFSYKRKNKYLLNI